MVKTSKLNCRIDAWFWGLRYRGNDASALVRGGRRLVHDQAADRGDPGLLHEVPVADGLDPHRRRRRVRYVGRGVHDEGWA